MNSELKIAFTVFGVIMLMIGTLIFGSIGIAAIARRLEWPSGILAALAIAGAIFAAICFVGWQIAERQESKSEQKP